LLRTSARDGPACGAQYKPRWGDGQPEYEKYGQDVSGDHDVSESIKNG
jgi:hypothetical protein